MARVRQRRMFWDAPQATDVTAYAVYAGAASAGADWLNQIDAGLIEPHVMVDTTEYVIADLEEGDYQFAVAALDDAGNYSDPYQHPAWASVPLDVTPPDAPSGGGLE